MEVEDEKSSCQIGQAQGIAPTARLLIDKKVIETN